MKKQLKISNKKKSIHLPILVEMDEDGIYIVSCSNFKSCHSYGKTIDEAMNNIKEVIEMCLEEEGAMETNKFIRYRELEFNLKALSA